MFLGVMFMDMDVVVLLVLADGRTEFGVQEVEEFFGVEVVGGGDGIGFEADAAIGEDGNFQGIGHGLLLGYCGEGLS
jgi:hypothetical protein